ncbi:MAG: inositol monophosphatase family protein [Chakrabartia sp.]
MRDPSLMAAVSQLLQDVAASAILPRWKALAAGDITEKAPNDFVTIADQESEARLTEALARLVPGSHVIGEEAVAATPDLLDGVGNGLVWLVDPLDGTGNFIAGRPDFAVMVALVDAGQVKAGWVYQPAYGRLYQAQAGGGAQCNGLAVRVQGSGNPGWVGAFPTRHAAPAQQEVINRLKARVDVALPGLLCAGVDYTRCLDGTQDFALFWRSLPWDHAPGSLILTEAGGWAGWRDGTPYRVGDQRPGLMALSTPDLLAQLG